MIGLMNWIRNTLVGHMVFSIAFSGVPFFLIMIETMDPGAPPGSRSWIFRAAVGSLAFGAGGGVVMWYAGTKRIKKRRSENRLD
jgi:hypothetical protein